MFSNFRPSIPPAASQTVTVCILCRQDGEDTNEYEEADCTLFKKGLPGWSGADFE
jgi:predicted metal-binding protein